MVVSLTLLLTTQCYARKCPNPEVISPCKCNNERGDPGFIEIRCWTNETIDIKKILSKASEDPDVVNTVFDILYIKEAKITELPEGATGKLRFKNVFIVPDVKSLQRIHSKAFASSQDTIREFNVLATNVTNGPAPYSLVDLINSFPNLKKLLLYSTIDTIQDG